jgi:hypothetical protein
MNYEQDLKIDAEALDKEWLHQPVLFMQYAAESAAAQDRLGRAKESLDVVKAEQDSLIRSQPSDKKPTEAAIAGMVLQTREYQEANERYLAAKLEYDLCQAAVRAMDQRKSALENLVRLLGASYFAAPAEPRDLGREWVKEAREQAREEVRDNIRERLSRRRA